MAMILFAILPQIARIASKGIPSFVISPFEVSINALLLAFPITIPIACLGGVAWTLHELSEERVEQTLATVGYNTKRLRVTLLLPVLLMTCCTCLLQHSTLAKAHYFIRSAGADSGVESIVDVISSHAITPEYGHKYSAYISGDQTTPSSLENFALVRPIVRYSVGKNEPDSVSAVSLIAEECNFSEMNRRDIRMSLENGFLSHPSIPTADAAIKFTSLTLFTPSAWFLNRGRGEWFADSRSIAQVVGDASRLDKESRNYQKDLQTIGFEPYYRLIMGLLPAILCLQLLLSTPRVMNAILGGYFFKCFLVILVLSAGCLLSTRSASHTAVYILIAELMIGTLAAPALIYGYSRGRSL